MATAIRTPTRTRSSSRRSSGLTFVHPFDDPDVIAGQGTIAMEILRQHQGPLDAVFVAIGGGGLISGVANYIKAVRPEIRVIGVQMNDSDAMAQSVAASKRVTLADVGLFSDGTAVKLVGQETFRIARELVDEFITVDTDAVCAAIKDVFVDTRSIVEPAGALAVAAIKQYVAVNKTRGEKMSKPQVCAMPSLCCTRHAVEGYIMSGVTVPTMMRSTSCRSKGCDACNFLTASTARSLAATPFPAIWRSRIPVRSSIHWSVVSTNFSRS